MSETLQNVEGASLLSTLANLFFKGMDKALSERAQYEEEMGVLKQVNTIPIETLDGTERYTLTVKLSPVRGKDSYYYVEAETDAPNLDVSKLHKKTLRLDNSNMREFRNTVDKLISSSNYVADMDRNDPEEPVGEVVGEPAEGHENDDGAQPGDVEAEGKLKAMMEKAQDWFDTKEIVGTAPGNHLVVIEPSFNKNANVNNCQLILTLLDAENQPIKDAEKLNNTKLQVVNDLGDVVSEESFLTQIDNKIHEFAELNHVESVTRGTRNAAVASATFIKDSEGIGLVAVKASSDLEKTMNIIYDIMDSDEFAEQIPEGEEVSFIIEETDDDYDIQLTDKIECTGCFADVYKVASRFYITLKSVEAMIGIKIWQNDKFFNDLTLAAANLQTRIAGYALDNADMLPILQDPFVLVPSFEKYRDYSDNSQIPDIKQRIAEDATLTVQLCNFYSVDFDADKQAEIEQLCLEIERILGEQ